MNSETAYASIVIAGIAGFCFLVRTEHYWAAFWLFVLISTLRMERS